MHHVARRIGLERSLGIHSARSLHLTGLRSSSTFPLDGIPMTLRTTEQPKPRIKREKQEDHSDRISSYIYFTTVFPIRIGILDLRHMIAKFEEQNLLDKIREIIPKDSLYDVRVDSVVGRDKDGGAFVKISFKLPETPYADEHDQESVEKRREAERQALSVIEKEISNSAGVSQFKPWWAWQPGRAILVKGKPWIEDMHRFPSSTLHVEFEGPEIPQEDLYALFRGYGRIRDIIPQPASNKDSPRWANINYRTIRSAAAARNCLHAAAIPSTLNPGTSTILRILYVEKNRKAYVRDFMASHPRIAVPIFVALLGVISFAIFDPIREFFIRAKLVGTLDPERWAVIRWLKRETLGRLGLTRMQTKAQGTGIEKQRTEAKEQLDNWLKDIPNTFIVVTGPNGSGKTSVVNETLGTGRHVLDIDCPELCRNARSDPKLVSELASAVGYWPQFVLGSSVANMLDLASMGLIGQKAGFANDLQTQLKSILEVTSSALSSIAAEARAKAAEAARTAEARRKSESGRAQMVEQLESEGVKDGRMDAVAGNGAMSELGLGVESPTEDHSAVIVGPRSAAEIRDLTRTTDPEAGKQELAALPIVVLRGFASKSDSAKHEVLWETLADWAAVLVENQVAHVVFVSDSVTVTKALARALPNKPFNQVTLDDASPDASVSWLQARLADFDKTLPESSRGAVARLGGRQTDLEQLVLKVQAGFDVEEAVQDIVARSATEIRKTYFGDDEAEAKGLKWTREQAWKILVGLTQHEELKYADVLVNAFKSDETALRALENAEMITIHHRDSRPSVIRPGKPVYRSAFQLLLSDDVFRASQEYSNTVSAINSANNDLKSASQGLIELSQLFASGTGKWIFGGSTTLPREVEVRVTALLAAMRDAEERLDKLGQQKKELLKVLAESK